MELSPPASSPVDFLKFWLKNRAPCGNFEVASRTSCISVHGPRTCWLGVLERLDVDLIDGT